MALLLLLAVTILSGLYYYYRQNTKSTIGGKISGPKSYWLFFALFHYYIFPVYLLTSLDVQKPGYEGLVLCFGLLAIRALVQTVLMFGSKNWTPTIGLAFNFSLVAAVVYSLSKMIWNGVNIQTWPFLVLYLLLLLAIAIMDSYYARQFHKLVGTKTMGRDAIWFAAPNDSLFTNINRITHRSNVAFTLVASFLIYLFLYGVPQS
jgi:uncharacterized protein (UPF0333 family)